MFYEILVPLDGSTHLDKIVRLAARTAIVGKSEIHVLCIVEATYLLPLDRMAITMSDGLTYPAANEQTEISNRFHADLIVMGHRNLSRLQRSLDSSTASRVLEDAPCPVLIETSKDG